MTEETKAPKPTAKEVLVADTTAETAARADPDHPVASQHTTARVMQTLHELLRQGHAKFSFDFPLEAAQQATALADQYGYDRAGSKFAKRGTV